MSLKVLKSRGSVYRQESDGIEEMSFAGFPAQIGQQAHEVSDYSEDDDDDDDEEQDMGRAIADFVAERPHEIGLRVGQVCHCVLQYVAVWCSVVQCGAVCCSVLQCVAVCCSVV